MSKIPTDRQSKSATRPIIFIIALIALTLYYRDVQAIRHTNIPNMLPPPMPAKKFLPAAPLRDTSFYKWESRGVVKAFADNGLEIEDIKPGYTMNPLTPQEATIFLIPSSGRNVGGYVSSYNSIDELITSEEFYNQFNKDPESPAWWIFQQDNILVLISGKVPEERARQYERVLKEMGTR